MLFVLQMLHLLSFSATIMRVLRGLQHPPGPAGFGAAVRVGSAKIDICICSNYRQNLAEIKCCNVNLICFKEMQTESSLSWTHIWATASGSALVFMWHWLLGLVCVLFSNLCYLYSLVKMDCGVLFFLVLFCVFLQCFDTVDWVIWPVKPVPDITYNVLVGR